MLPEDAKLTEPETEDRPLLDVLVFIADFSGS
jgi:hypothetical protein